MSTLLLRLAAPLQSWGVGAKYDTRGTQRAPTKSGVVGMISAALGRRRDERIDDLNALRFGVRTDREGQLLHDYHTVKGEKSYITHRYYLSDALFLAGLEGDGDLLAKIEYAIRNPVFPLFLGRRSCPPEGRVSLGIRDTDLLEALRVEPWLVSDWVKKREITSVRLRITADALEDDGKAFFQRDVPLSFNQLRREYGFRRVTDYILPEFSNPNSRLSTASQQAATIHDAFLELMEG